MLAIFCEKVIQMLMHGNGIHLTVVPHKGVVIWLQTG